MISLASLCASGADRSTVLQVGFVRHRGSCRLSAARLTTVRIGGSTGKSDCRFLADAKARWSRPARAVRVDLSRPIVVRRTAGIGATLSLLRAPAKGPFTHPLQTSSIVQCEAAAR
jgi:hypothetical protein